jgi:hypothetical protein
MDGLYISRETLCWALPALDDALCLTKSGEAAERTDDQKRMRRTTRQNDCVQTNPASHVPCLGVLVTWEGRILLVSQQQFDNDGKRIVENSPGVAYSITAQSRDRQKQSTAVDSAEGAC